MRRIIILSAVLLAACGSESSDDTPPCPETWVQSATSCVPPDREIVWNVYASTPENISNLDQSFICQTDTTDGAMRLDAWKNELGVVARDGECVVTRNLTEAESARLGGTFTTPTGTYSITKGTETIGHRQGLGPCVSTDAPPNEFFEPGNTYALSGAGTDAGDFEYDVLLPGPTTFSQVGTPNGINVTWQPFGADRVVIRFGQTDPYREITCETDDDGEFLVSDWILAELNSDVATFRIEGENVRLYQLDDGTRLFVRGSTSYEQTFFLQ
jgi:hypothetical protein